MNILEELKISKKQNKHERYEYLCSQFNAIDYCIRLEKYTNKLQQENKKYKEVIDKIRCEFLKYDWKTSNSTQIYNQLSEIFKLLSIELDILKEVSE